jgi:hypothetical protein
MNRRNEVKKELKIKREASDGSEPLVCALSGRCFLMMSARENKSEEPREILILAR